MLHARDLVRLDNKFYLYNSETCLWIELKEPPTERTILPDMKEKIIFNKMSRIIVCCDSNNLYDLDKKIIRSPAREDYLITKGEANMFTYYSLPPEKKTDDGDIIESRKILYNSIYNILKTYMDTYNIEKILLNLQDILYDIKKKKILHFGPNSRLVCQILCRIFEDYIDFYSLSANGNLECLIKSIFSPLFIAVQIKNLGQMKKIIEYFKSHNESILVFVSDLKSGTIKEKDSIVVLEGKYATWEHIEQSLKKLASMIICYLHSRA